MINYVVPLTDQLRNCKNHFTEKNRGLITYFLNFTSPSLNDTGEYICSNYDGDVGTTIFIAVGKRKQSFNIFTCTHKVHSVYISVHKATTKIKLF